MTKHPPISMQQLWQALRELESSWASQSWAGLPKVLTGCLNTLGYSHEWASQQQASLRHMRNSLDALALDVERIGLDMHRAGTEPPYHNRLHMAQVLTSMTALLLAHRNSHALTPSDMGYELALVAAALGHDVLHDGGRNTSPRQGERRSAAHVSSVLAKAGVSHTLCQHVADIIELTDPVDVANNHSQLHHSAKQHIGESFVSCVLANEADILASTLPDIGAKLTQRLAQEWQPHYPQDAQAICTKGGRIFFLSNLALFSSRGACRLGMPEIRLGELQKLGVTQA